MSRRPVCLCRTDWKSLSNLSARNADHPKCAKDWLIPCVHIICHLSLVIVIVRLVDCRVFLLPSGTAVALGIGFFLFCHFSLTFGEGVLVSRDCLLPDVLKEMKFNQMVCCVVSRDASNYSPQSWSNICRALLRAEPSRALLTRSCRSLRDSLIVKYRPLNETPVRRLIASSASSSDGM